MDVVERCSNYLSSGGLFNPEFADHDAVRDLVINCRDEIERLREALKDMSFYITGHNWMKLKPETMAIYDAIYQKKGE